MKNKSLVRKGRIKKQKPAKINSRNDNFFGNYLSTINAKGSSLSNPRRSFFEGRMNENFGDVKLHQDKDASLAAKEIGAKAFTYQNHIVVNGEYFEPGSLKSMQLLAHELKHVQQQKSGNHRIQMMPEEDSAAPKEDEPMKQNSGGGEAITMEKEAQREEELILTPEKLPDFQTFGTPITKTVKGTSVSFEGETNATYDGGIGTTRGLARTSSDNCVGCEEGDCFHYTGTLEINYNVSTSVTLPDVPDGLRPCQHERVSEAINGDLAAHEQDHVSAFSAYNGSVSLPIDYTGCSAGIRDYVQQLHLSDAAAREARVNAASAELDPFHISVDLDCEDAPPPSNPDDDK